MTDTQTTPADDLDAKINQVGALAANTQTTNITVVIDRSGSMSHLRDDVVGGLNSFIEEQQQQPGTCLVTVWQFDTGNIDIMIERLPIANVKPLNSRDYQPRGGTPLYDAIGTAMDDAEKHHTDGDAEIFMIITDGQENSSRTHTKASIFERIKAHAKEGWVFSYVGAAHDAYAAGSDIGIGRASTQSFAHTSDGTRAAFASVSRAASGARHVYGSSGVKGLADTYAQDFFQGIKEAEDEEK